MHLYKYTYICLRRVVGIKYSRDGGSSWFLSGGGYPTSGINWLSIASSSDGRFVAAGYYDPNGPGKFDIMQTVDLIYMPNQLDKSSLESEDCAIALMFLYCCHDDVISMLSTIVPVPVPVYL